MMSRLGSDTIAAVGLPKYLDNTKEFHNGRGYREYRELRLLKVHKTTIALLFNVNRSTIDYWVAREGDLTI